MHIQVSEAMFVALKASQLGYVMKHRGEVEIKVRLISAVVLIIATTLLTSRILKKRFAAAVTRSLPAGCREAANCRYCFYSQAKNQVFRPQGRLVAPIQVILCRTDGHLGPLGCAKFRINRCRGVGMRPPNYQKFPLFGKESPLDRFPNFLGAFIRLTILR